MKYRAVIFDLFGTLIDNFTHSAHEAVLREMAGAMGVPGDGVSCGGGWGAMSCATGARFPATEGNIAYVLGTMGASAEPGGGATRGRAEAGVHASLSDAARGRPPHARRR